MAHRGLRAFGYRAYALATQIYVRVTLSLMRQALPACLIIELLTDVPLTDAGCGAGGHYSWGNDDLDSPFNIRIDPENPGRPHPVWSVDTLNFSSGDPTPNEGIRNPRQFWQQWLADESSRPVPTLSQANIDRINNDRLSPLVDDTWLRSFPEHTGALREAPKFWVLDHHHVNQGRFAIPIPHAFHKGYDNMWHPRDGG